MHTPALMIAYSTGVVVQLRYVRTYSDDTVNSDLKMSAVSKASWLLSEHPSDVGAEVGSRAAQAGPGAAGGADSIWTHCSTPPSLEANLLQLCVLQQYLKWAHIAEENPEHETGGCLFQGWGGFTYDFLVPQSGQKGRNGNAVSAAMQGHPLHAKHRLFGEFWPTAEFVSFAERYFGGDPVLGGFGPSWGNGAVMSFAPDPIAATQGHVQPEALANAASIMSESHRHALARCGAKLLSALLPAIYSADSACTPADVREIVRSLPAWADVKARLVELADSGDDDTIPHAAFDEWLRNGDCTVETATMFANTLTRTDEFTPAAASSGPFGVFGAMLRHLANYDDDHGANWLNKSKKRRSKLCRQPPHGKEPVLFSQRGLNSVIIAIWSSSTEHVKTPIDFLTRVLYVGGDTDTVGAVAGQIACPLLNAREVAATFFQIVGLSNKIASSNSTLRTVHSSACRYFDRACAFASGDLSRVHESPSLLDPEYPGITNATGSSVVAGGGSGGGGSGGGGGGGGGGLRRSKRNK